MGPGLRTLGVAVTAVPNPQFWSGRRVLVTGHSGFKGAWLTCWLRALGSQVLGVSLPEPPTTPSLWAELGRTDVTELHRDITRTGWFEGVAEFSPEVVVHLAAQSLVPLAHAEPELTFSTNVGGTVAVMQALDSLPDLVAALIVTSDKVYDPRQPPPYDESHFLGGLEPYAASKAAAELVVQAWPTTAPRATARAGNVIGGGDWAARRLLPDLVRAWQRGAVPELRAPLSVRPWQHVLEPLRGYLLYVEALAAGRELPPALNFGPADGQLVDVQQLADHAAGHWQRATGATSRPAFTTASVTEFHETTSLTLDSRLAKETLDWQGVLDWQSAVALTLDWHLGLDAGQPAQQLVSAQLSAYAASLGEAA